MMPSVLLELVFNLQIMVIFHHCETSNTEGISEIGSHWNTKSQAALISVSTWGVLPLDSSSKGPKV